MTSEKQSVEQIASDKSAKESKEFRNGVRGAAASHAFPSLRQGYLRAIEHAWGGPEERKEFERRFPEPKDESGKRLPEPKDGDDWKDALGELRDRYGVHFPYKVKFIIKYNSECEDNQPFFDARLSGKWYAHMDEFVIYIPTAPENVRDYSALATEYYKHFPTLLGQPSEDHQEANSISVRDLGDTGIPDEFYEFGQVVHQMLPLIWSKTTYWEAIVSPDGKNKIDARQAIADLMNYHVPWNFRLEFREYKEDYPSRQDNEEDGSLRGRRIKYWLDWRESTLNQIVVNLPLKPQGWRPVDDPESGAHRRGTPSFGDDQEVMEAVALAAYNATGPMYPFTCG